jgi:hypothetical protein
VCDARPASRPDGPGNFSLASWLWLQDFKSARSTDTYDWGRILLGLHESWKQSDPSTWQEPTYDQFCSRRL